MSYTQEWKNRLKDKITKSEVVYYAGQLHNDEHGICCLCNIMFNEKDKRLKYNTAWVLSHLSKEDKDIFLQPFYDKITDMAISPDLNIRRGLILSIIADMEIKEYFRTDLFDFCLDKIADKKECDSSRSVMIKIAGKICKSFPDLKNELIPLLELMSEEMKPGISAASRNMLSSLRKKQ